VRGKEIPNRSLTESILRPQSLSLAPNASMPRLALARTMQLTQGALKTLNFAFVINLLSFREFESLEHFLHFIE